MKFLIRHDITGQTFIVEGRTTDECRRIADTECETRKWNVLEVGSERIENEPSQRKQVYVKEIAR